MTLMQMLSVKNLGSVVVVNHLWWIVAMNLMMTVEMEKKQELFVIVSLGTMMSMKIIAIAQGLADDHHHHHHHQLFP